jgi:nucleoside-diphosphate-sugar epimerase
VHALAVTGAAGRLGQRVLVALGEPDEAHEGHDGHGRREGHVGHVDRVVALDRFPVDRSLMASSIIEVVTTNLESADLVPAFRGCSVLVHLASDSGGPAGADNDPALTSRVLEAADAAGVTHLVVVSSAVVYGARPDNPVPLTESVAPLPNDGFPFAASRLEVERIAEAWRHAQPGRTLTILRPAVSPSASGTSGWLADAVFPSRVDQLFGTLPPVQYVHVDDVASAVVHSARRRLDGVFNVAPDRWIRGEDAPALMGTPFSIPATGRIWERVSVVMRLVVRPLFKLQSRPEGATPWARYPWVVANDRLRATGWVPLSTSEEVLVARRAPSRWSKLFARRRQEVTIAAVGVAVATSAGTAISIWKKWLRRA